MVNYPIDKKQSDFHSSPIIQIPSCYFIAPYCIELNRIERAE